MQNTQTKIKSFIVIGLFLALFLGFSLSNPGTAAASVETVSTQISYQAETVYSEMAAYDQVSNNPIVTTESLQDDKEVLVNSDQTETDNIFSWYLEWLEKLLKKTWKFGKSLAWSG